MRVQRAPFAIRARLRCPVCASTGNARVAAGDPASAVNADELTSGPTEQGERSILLELFPLDNDLAPSIKTDSLIDTRDPPTQRST